MGEKISVVLYDIFKPKKVAEYLKTGIWEKNPNKRSKFSFSYYFTFDNIY